MAAAPINKEVLKRAKALLAQMSLEQKVGQMTQAERLTCTPEDVKEFHLGSVLSGSGSAPELNTPAGWLEMNDAFWAASTLEDEDHLAIPILYGVDAVHGHNNLAGATIFPHNIGLGATHDCELIERVGQITAREMLATGVDWSFAPVVAVAKDFRWGRTYESFSEDPEHVSNSTAAFIRGLQSDFDGSAILACAKHWVGEGGTDSGVDHGDTALSEQELRSTHIRPYVAAVKSGVLTIMTSYSSWQGEKCHRNRDLISRVLKQEMQFAGFVVSDWEGISYLSEDYYEAIGMGVNAGIDMFMVPETWRTFIDMLLQHVRSGTVPLVRIDDAVTRILSVKIASGLFDRPTPSRRALANDPGCGGDRHREIARDAVRKSLVLLKNLDNRLPLDKQMRILVAGKNAHNRGHQCGGFTLSWQGESGNEAISGGQSVWEGIKQAAPRATLVNNIEEFPILPREYDVAIVVIGEKPYAEGAGDVRTGNNVIVQLGSQISGQMRIMAPYGNSLELAQLHPEDLATLQKIAHAEIPIVAVMISGRPLVVDRELELVDSFVAAWLPGSEGQGIADVLFGDFDFHGRLSFSWPTQTNRDALKHGDACNAGFPRGYGLKYADPKLEFFTSHARG